MASLTPRTEKDGGRNRMGITDSVDGRAPPNIGFNDTVLSKHFAVSV